MRTPGTVLRELREKKGYSQQRVANETNISLQYITALEDDMFDEFPGEPYLLGFLKTYAEYLGISQANILAIYENYKLSEMPVPMHELMSREHLKVPGWVWGLLASLVLAGAMAWITIPFVQKKYYERQKKLQEQESVRQSEQAVHEITDEVYSGVLRLNDKIKVTIGENNLYIFTPVKMNGSETDFEQFYNEEQIPEKFSINLGEEKYFTLGDSTQANFVIKITDIGLENGKAISFEAQKLTSFKNRHPKSVSAAKKTVAPPVPQNLTKNIEDVLGKRRVILSMRSPIRVEINITFTGNTNFRYLLDGRESHERYYQEGERLQRSMNTNFRLWTSNAGKTRLKIGLHEVSLGKDGEIVVKLLRWVYNSRTGGYDLVLEDYN